VQEYSDQRFDHSRRIGCKGDRPEFVKPGPRSGLTCVYDDDVAADIKAGGLMRILEKWCPVIPGYYLYRPNRRQTLPTFAALIAALSYKFWLRNGKLSAAGSSR
jgi:hypothetical protein